MPLTRAGVARALGPTYANDGALAYPGVVFSVPPGRDESVASLSVVPKEDDEALGELQSCVLQVSHTGCGLTNNQPGHGATLALKNGSVEINLGETTAQDLLIDLGPPLRKYWKEDDRLGRVWGGHNLPNHAATTGRDDDAAGDFESTPCFWNYFQYGMDFLIEAGVVTKVITHTNIVSRADVRRTHISNTTQPGTPQFQQYARCPWVVQCDPGELDFTHPLSAFRERLQEGGTPSSAPSRSSNGTPEGGKKNKKKQRNGSSNAAVPPKDTPADAMILDRSVEGGLEGVVGMGVSQLVGFDGLIVEVDEKSGGVTSVQVWGPLSNASRTCTTRSDE